MPTPVTRASTRLEDLRAELIVIIDDVFTHEITEARKIEQKVRQRKHRKGSRD